MKSNTVYQASTDTVWQIKACHVPNLFSIDRMRQVSKMCACVSLLVFYFTHKSAYFPQAVIVMFHWNDTRLKSQHNLLGQCRPVIHN